MPPGVQANSTKAPAVPGSETKRESGIPMAGTTTTLAGSVRQRSPRRATRARRSAVVTCMPTLATAATRKTSTKAFSRKSGRNMVHPPFSKWDSVSSRAV